MPPIQDGVYIENGDIIDVDGIVWDWAVDDSYESELCHLAADAFRIGRLTNDVILRLSDLPISQCECDFCQAQ